MKTQPIKKPNAFIIQIILPIFILLFVNSCQKVRYAAAEIIKTSTGSSIIYTDLIPDTIRTCSGICSKNYYLDLNKDGINDFSFSVSSVLVRGGCLSKYKTSVKVLPLNLNSVTPSKLALNEIINGNNNLWSSESQVLRSHYSWSDGFSPCNSYYSGQWSTTADGYLSLKININNHVYYGWARLSVTVGFAASFTIKDYAYNSTPNQSILAGQTK